ncbi:MAG: hypothetical protein IID18_06050, partial [Nitrospinae bacterium]|nr:hypothetical protein [Nitrospinota bacterium]
IRKGRLQVNELAADDLAVSGRLEYSRLYPGLNVGFSFYTGDTTHGNIKEDGRVNILEGDIQFRKSWFDMNASIANIDIGDATALNTYCASQPGCTNDIADNIFGWNVQAGVHLFQLLGKRTSHDLVPWVMYERIRPQDSMPSGTAPTPRRNFDEWAGGLTYYPISNVALKADYQHFKFDDGSSSSEVNLGIAYMY